MVSTVMQTLHQSVVVKKELNQRAKLLINRSVYVPTVSYGHEPWVVMERMRLRIHTGEMSYLHWESGLFLRDRVRSLVIWEGPGLEPLLLCVERSQMRWLGHLGRMLPGRLPAEVFRAHPTGRRPRGKPRTHWRDCVSRLAWDHPWVALEELDAVGGKRESGLLRLDCCSRDPTRISGRGWIDGLTALMPQK